MDASPRGHRNKSHSRHQSAKYKFDLNENSSGSRQNAARFKFESNEESSGSRQNAARFNSPRAYRARVKRRQKVGFVGIDDSEHRSHELHPLDPFSRSVEHKFTDFDHKAYDFGHKVSDFGHNFDQRVVEFSPGILRTESEEDSRCTLTTAHVHI